MNKPYSEMTGEERLDHIAATRNEDICILSNNEIKNLLDALCNTSDMIGTAISPTYHFKGILDYVDLLPMENNSEGDVYVIKYEGTSEENLHIEKKKEENTFIWRGKEWDLVDNDFDDKLNNEELMNILDTISYAEVETPSYLTEAKVEHMRKCGVVIKGTKWMKLKLLRKKGNCDVLLLPHKDGSCYTYINLTKYHICPCKFSTIEDAVIDLANKPDIIRYEIISTGFYILKAICIENALGNPSYTVGKSYIVDNTGMTNNFSDKTNIDTWWNAVDLKPKCEEGIEFRHCGCKFRFEFE